MAKLECDICRGNLLVNAGGRTATCRCCGVEYSAERLREKLQEITGTADMDVSVGAVYDAELVRIIPIGCVARLSPSGREGFLHIKCLADPHVEKLEDAVSVGDKIRVEVCDIDARGRISLKQVLA